MTTNFPPYIQSMMFGTAVLKRVVVAEDEVNQEDDAPTVCTMILSEDLETITFEGKDVAWELPISEVTKIIHFEDDSSKTSQEDLLLGFLVPSDRLVVALEFANAEDIKTWSHGMQVLTFRADEEAETEPEQAEPEDDGDDAEIEFDDLQQENQLLREALAARDETVQELLGLVQTLIKRQLQSEPSATAGDDKGINSPRRSVQVLGA